jgi:mono/diheme cytochrome c family protein
MRRALLIPILLSLALLARPVLPADSAQGKKLHDTNCVKCHNTSVYTRQDRKIKSLDALNERLVACTHAAQVTLTDDEQKSIAQYLNEQFYKFK